MTRKEIIENNELIADFFDWPVSYRNDYGLIVYHVPNNFKNPTKFIELNTGEFMFDTDWNWLHYVWHDLYRKVLIPVNKDNPRLKRELNYMVKKMRNALMYSHIQGAYEALIVLIKWYNKQLGE